MTKFRSASNSQAQSLKHKSLNAAIGSQAYGAQPSGPSSPKQFKAIVSPRTGGLNGMAAPNSQYSNIMNRRKSNAMSGGNNVDITQIVRPSKGFNKSDLDRKATSNSRGKPGQQVHLPPMTPPGEEIAKRSDPGDQRVSGSKFKAPEYQN